MAKNDFEDNSDEVIETPAPVVVDTSKDKDMGRLLQGRPTYLDNAVGERLMAEGLAAKTDEGWVRGHKWHQFYGG